MKGIKNMVATEDQFTCKKCNITHPDTACFCQGCGQPLNEEGKKKQSGWKIVFYDFCLPGSGHYAIGRKKTGYILMTVFLLSFTLYALSSMQIALNIVNQDLLNSSDLSVESVQKSLNSKKTFYNSFLSWTYFLTWAGTLAHSIKLQLKK